MTVKIGEMTAEFANSTNTYVAIGMNVTDSASSANSKLLNLMQNNNTRVSVEKTGALKINGEVTGSNNLFTIQNFNNNIITVDANNITLHQNTISNQTSYVRAYSEGFISQNSRVLDLTKASVFKLPQTYGGTPTFILPNIPNHAFSCTVLYQTIVGNESWAGMVWPQVVIPTQGPAIVTYYIIDGIIYGMLAGEGFA